MCASFFALLSNVIEVDGTHMSRVSVYDQFVCRIWLTGVPFWSFLVTSTYQILLTALERYIAVIYPVWYNVRMNDYYAARCMSNVTQPQVSVLHFLSDLRSTHQMYSVGKKIHVVLIQIYSSVCIHTYTHIHTYICVCVCVYVCMYMYVYTRINLD